MVRDIAGETRGIIREQLHVGSDRITLRLVHDDLGADSFDLVELTFAFEEHFDIDISDEDAERSQTVKVGAMEGRKESESGKLGAGGHASNLPLSRGV
jgi:acyl carrier protein